MIKLYGRKKLKMAHEITVREDGTAEAVYALTPAWHELGTVLDHAPTSKEAIIQAHLNWSVELFPVKAHIPQTLKDNSFTVAFEYADTDKMATVRMDNHETLGIVSDHYKIIQNTEAFAFMDSLVYNNDLFYESAGSLRGGKYIWLLARFPTEYAVSDDDISRDYVLLVSSHDGTKAVRILPTNVRVVCWNTMTYALKSAAEKMIIRHKGDIQNSLEETRNILHLLNSTNQQVHDMMKGLSNKETPSEKVTEFINQVFPLPVVKDDETKEISTKLTNIRNRAQANFEEMNTKATIGTAYGLFNSVTQYVDHQRGLKSLNSMNRREYLVKRAKIFESSFLGSGLVLKQKALEVVQTI